MAPTAACVGDVVIEEGTSIWFGPVLRAHFRQDSRGAGRRIQDNCVVLTGEELPTLIGQNVTVGYLSLLEGCVIEDEAIIDMRIIVLNQAHVGWRAMLAAGEW